MPKIYFWVSLAIAAGLIYGSIALWGPEIRESGTAIREEVRTFHVDPPDPRLATARYHSVPLEIVFWVDAGYHEWGGLLASYHQLPAISGVVTANGLGVHNSGLRQTVLRDWNTRECVVSGVAFPCLVWRVLVEFEYGSSTSLAIDLQEDLGPLNPMGSPVGHLGVPLVPNALVDYHRLESVIGSARVRGGTITVRQTGPAIAPPPRT